jgi:uncharacterized membrane protein YidH (DUF202 family)
MANEISPLAFARTSLEWFLGAAGLFKFLGPPISEIVGIMLVVISVTVLYVAIRKYRTIKKLISYIDPEDWQALEAMVKKG